MKKVGITGSIGAGKSFVGSLLRNRGFRVLDADVAVHDLYRENAALRGELAENFGEECLTPSGVNRDYFIRKIFSDDVREPPESSGCSTKSGLWTLPRTCAWNAW